MTAWRTFGCRKAGTGSGVFRVTSEKKWRCAASAALASLSFAASAWALPPTIHTPVIVTEGVPNAPVNETSVAWAGYGRLMALYNLAGATGSPMVYAVGYAYSDDGGFTWTDQANGQPLRLMSTEAYWAQMDPYVVFHPLNERFVGGGIAYMTNGDIAGFAALADPNSLFGPFTRLPHVPGDFTDHTRAAIRPAPMLSAYAGREIYITSSHAEGGAIYLHSSFDGGLTWTRQQVQANGSLLPGTCPTVTPDGRLFVAYQYGVPWPDPTTTETHITMLRSDDLGFSFERLNVDVPRTFIRHLPPYYYFDKGAIAAGWFRIGDIFNAAADPSDPNRVYIVYEDQTGPFEPVTFDADLDVYLLRTADGGRSWDTVPISDGPHSGQTNVRNDQFMPAITVDQYGTIHMIWYDTRRTMPARDQLVDCEIDLFYAYSVDHGASFQQYNLYNPSTYARAALRPDELVHPYFMGDYISITCRTMPDGGVGVVGVYTGTSGPLTKDAIYAVRIDFAGAPTAP